MVKKQLMYALEFLKKPSKPRQIIISWIQIHLFQRWWWTRVRQGYALPCCNPWNVPKLPSNIFFTFRQIISSVLSCLQIEVNLFQPGTQAMPCLAAILGMSQNFQDDSLPCPLSCLTHPLMSRVKSCQKITIVEIIFLENNMWGPMNAIISWFDSNSSMLIIY